MLWRLEPEDVVPPVNSASFCSSALCSFVMSNNFAPSMIAPIVATSTKFPGAAVKGNMAGQVDRRDEQRVVHYNRTRPSERMDMLEVYDDARRQNAGRYELSDALEQGSIVHFPTSPVPLPSDEDLVFFREELPKLLRLKNISYHHEAGYVRGLDDADPHVAERVSKVLVTVSDDIAEFLRSSAPSLTDNWTVGTCGFRPIEEKGRKLKPHASNELVHIDAGAYGATNGDRILRFFINVNPHDDRVWATKGRFPELYERYGKAAKIKPDKGSARYLKKGPLDHLRSGLLNGIALAGLPTAKVLDSSPYDRLMRKFHNYMKDTPSFQQDELGYREFRFPPYSAWMVLTDMVSHASRAGQFAFVHTSIVRLSNCRKPELAPYNILRASAGVS